MSSLRRIYRRLRYGPPIVVVSGLPRSGTSMAMKMLEAGGMKMLMDGVREADDDNPKGYYELERVKDLAKDKDKSWLGEGRGKVVKVISYLLKELPRTHNYRVVFMRRDLGEVMASQSKMLVNREENSDTDDERMVDLFESDLWRAGYLLKKAPHFEAIYVRYASVLSDPRVEAERINEFLGGALDADRMAAVVDPTLYRNRAKRD